MIQLHPFDPFVSLPSRPIKVLIKGSALSLADVGHHNGTNPRCMNLKNPNHSTRPWNMGAKSLSGRVLDESARLRFIPEKFQVLGTGDLPFGRCSVTRLIMSLLGRKCNIYSREQTPAYRTRIWTVKLEIVSAICWLQRFSLW